jgi:hypothetical protein
LGENKRLEGRERLEGGRGLNVVGRKQESERGAGGKRRGCGWHVLIRRGYASMADVSVGCCTCGVLQRNPCGLPFPDLFS